MVDLSSETGLKALLSACEYLAGSDNTKSRFAVFDSSNSAGATREYLGYILKLFETSKIEVKDALEAIVAFLKELLDGKSVADAKKVVKQKLESLGVQVDADDSNSLASMINEIGYLKSKNILKNINHGDNLIIVNGRVIRDVSNADETLFELIEGYERTRILDNSKLGLMKINKYDSDTMMVATSIANQYMKYSRSSFNFLSIKNSKKKFKKNSIICNPRLNKSLTCGGFNRPSKRGCTALCSHFDPNARYHKGKNNCSPESQDRYQRVSNKEFLPIRWW